MSQTNGGAFFRAGPLPTTQDTQDKIGTCRSPANSVRHSRRNPPDSLGGPPRPVHIFSECVENHMPSYKTVNFLVNTEELPDDESSNSSGLKPQERRQMSLSEKTSSQDLE